MALNDYSIEDEDDYYSQGFEIEKCLSLWVGMSDNSSDRDGLDVLQDLCGVGFYDLDYQESNCFDFELTDIELLIKDLSYSESYLPDVLKKLKEVGILQAKWIIVQFDFAYDPKKVKRTVAEDPIFIGVFKYDDNQSIL